jgi:hypothetical protein
VPHFVFLNELKTQLSNNQEFQQLKLKIAQQPASYIEYQEHQDLIFFKEKIWLPRDFPLKDRILNEFHNSPISGHMGVDKTFHRLQANFFWQGMRQDIRKYIAQCSVCQSTKYETKKPGGFLQPLPVPSGIWEDLSLDFITGLPPSHGCTTILVVVDRFSKGAHFGALPPTYTAYKVAQLFLDMVCKHHGVPRSLVSDRDPIFISQFWRELFKLSGTQLRMSTAYHPETDGQTEVLNRSLEQYLRAFVHHKPSLWLTFLPLAEWSYNTTKHSATGYSPFHVMYGKEPATIPQYVLGTSPIEAVDSMLAERQNFLLFLRRKLLKVQSHMKEIADKKRRPVEFNVGDFVYLKLRPYRQRSLTLTSYNKLSKRYFGPYKILQKIGPVAYKLDLPPTSKLHPVFHCSLLKLHQGDLPANHVELPPSTIYQQPIIEPLVILDTKMDTTTDPPTHMVLVQWLGLSPEETSWENWEVLKATYHLEDKVTFPGGCIDSNTTTKDLPKRITRKPAHLRDYVCVMMQHEKDH